MKKIRNFSLRFLLTASMLSVAPTALATPDEASVLEQADDAQFWLVRDRLTSEAEFLSEITDATGRDIQVLKKLNNDRYLIRLLDEEGDALSLNDADFTHIQNQVSQRGAFAGFDYDWNVFENGDETLSEDGWQREAYHAGRKAAQTHGGQRIGLIGSGAAMDHKVFRGKFDSSRTFDGSENNAEATESKGTNWLGTRVAGLLAGVQNNSNRFTSMNAHADLVSARVFNDEGTGTIANVFDAMAWNSGLLADKDELNGSHDYLPQVTQLNFRIGSAHSPVFTCPRLLQAEINNYVDMGHIFTAPAYVIDGQVTAPASCDGVISVGMMGRDGDVLEMNSNIDIYALNSAYTPNGDDLYNGFDTATSPEIAAAHVTGTISWMRGAYEGMTAESARFMLRNAGFDCDACGNVPALDAGTAVEDANLYAQVETEKATGYNLDGDFDVASGRDIEFEPRVSDDGIRGVVDFSSRGCSSSNTGLISFASLCFLAFTSRRRRFR